MEVVLAGSELPVPATGNHPTFDIPVINAFIASQRRSMLNWYETHLLDDSDMSGVTYPRFEDRARPSPDEPLYSAGLMRIADLATLFQLILWRFIEENDQSAAIDSMKDEFDRELKKIAKCGIKLTSMTEENCSFDKTPAARLESILKRLKAEKERREESKLI